MALQMRSDDLGNEAIYRQNWASYVDSAISRHQSSGAHGIGDPIDLRDVMQLEELLSKIEHAAASCEGDGRVLINSTGTRLLLERQEAENKAPACTRDSRCDGARPKRKERKPLKIISRPPALCQSPCNPNSAPCLGSPCPASGHGDQESAPSDLARFGSKDERQQEENPAYSPGRSLERATVVVTKKETGNAEPAYKQNRRDAGISSPSLVAGKVAAVVCLFEGLTANIEGQRDEENGGLSHEKLQVSGNRDGRATVLEKPLCPGSPVVPEREHRADLECSPRLVPLDSGLGAPVPRDISSPSLQTVGDARGAQADRSHDDVCTARMAGCEEHTVVAGTPSGKEENEECPSAGEAQGVKSILADVLSTSARLDVTCIEVEEAASSEERLPSAMSQDYPGLLEGTVLEVRRGDSRGELSGVDMTTADMKAAGMTAPDEEGALFNFVGQDLTPLEPSGNDSSSTTDKVAEVAPFDLTNDQRSWERERDVSAGGSQSPRVEGLSDVDGSGESSSSDSIPRGPRTPASLSRVRDNSMGAAASVQSRALVTYASRSSRKGSSECGDRPPTVDDLGELNAESPDVVMRGSMSRGSDNRPRGPASDRGSWGTDALGRRCSGDRRDCGLSFAMQQSQDSQFGDRSFGSTLSPAIGGFGVHAADALSPLLAKPLFVDELDDIGNSGSEGFSDGGLSPGVSARLDSTVEREPTFSSGHGQSMVVPNQVSEETHARTPDSSWLSESKALSATTPMEQAGGEGSKDFTLPTSSLREPLAQRGEEQRHEVSVRQPMTPERHPVVPDSRTELRDERSPPGRYCNTSPAASGNVVGEYQRDESFLDTAQSSGDDRSDRDEQVSIGSFSESEIGGDSFKDEREEGKCRYEGDADVSLIEGTPRQRGVGSGENLAGFYAPLPVANTGKATKDTSLSTLQRSTLQWMAWRESEDTGGGQRREGTEAAARLESSLSGGMLGHLSSEEASACVLALIQQEAANAPGGKNDRVGRLRAGTGLPRGTNLVIAPTKDVAEVWSNMLGAGGGLAVLNYVMPLKERRRLSAKQVAAFQVVVTTYDILKAKEVPHVVDASVTSPSACARSSTKWNTRDTPARRRATSKTGHMMSLLHGVWWHRVVADGAQLLANQRSARATAALSLVGRARWCVVEREGMATLENTSERMRSLAAFLRVPDVMPLVEATGCLFYHSRPSHVAPIPCRGPGPDTSLTEDDSPGSRRLPHDTRMNRGTGHSRALASRLTADENDQHDSQVGGGGRSDVAGGAGTSVGGCCGRDGGGGVGAGLSRSDVTYVATTLRLRKAHVVKPRQTGPRRQER